MKLSTKILAVALGSAIAVAFVFSAVATTNAAGYVFTRSLTVGATGSDVMQLQLLLNSNPATKVAATGAGSPGMESSYFGGLTKAALAKYQAANGISPAVGYFGPITMAFVNGNGGVVSTGGALCPNGNTLASNCMTAPSTATNVALCPNGNTLASNCMSAPSGSVVTGGTVNDGTDGSISASQSSYVSSGIQLKKGDTKDILAIHLQATTGAVTVSRADVHFNLRPWLIFSQLTLHDSTGKVIATKALNSAADVTEVTVGSDYLVRFDNISDTVTPGSPVDLVVGATVLGATDKISNNQVVNVTFGTNGLRTLNGKGYTDSISGTAVNGVASAASISALSGVGANSFTLVSTGSVADIFTRISPNTPLTRQQAVSLTQTTSNVVLGTFSLKSANNSSTLNALNVTLATSSISTPLSAFSNVRLVVGSQAYGGVLSSNGVVAFTNLNIPLAVDTWSDLSIETDITASTTGTVSTSLVANTSNIVVTDANYNTATIESNTATSNVTTLTTNAIAVTSASLVAGSAIVQGNNTVGYNVTGTIVLQNTSNNDLFVSGTSTTLVNQTINGAATTTNGLNGAITTSPSIEPADGTNPLSYNIPAGLSRSFTINGVIRASSGASLALKVVSINYSASSATTTGSTITAGLDNMSTSVAF